MIVPIEIQGKYTTAKIFAHTIEDTAKEQVQTMTDQPFAKGSKISIMPDVHAGKGCTIGTTMTITDKVVPNLVGVDIGCGMLTVPLGKVKIDLPKFDQQVKRSIPSGAGKYHKNPVGTSDYVYEELRCLKKINLKNLDNMLGTLGGGNHFIELDKDEEDNIYLVIHSGSRNLGRLVCDYYQKLAIDTYRHGFEEVQEIIGKCKEEGRSRDIEGEIKAWHASKDIIPPQLCYLTGQDKEDYLHDMKICQQWASQNRLVMAQELLKHYFYPMDVKFSETLKLKIKEKGFKISTQAFETPHNYIDTEKQIIRKGAISAQKGEQVIIPINMRDGAILAWGEGIADMNYSLPHGAGRLMSRKKALETIKVEEFKDSMTGVYSSVVGEGTLDEAPQAYKSMETLLEILEGMVEDLTVIKPIYNFKAAEDPNRRWK